MKKVYDYRLLLYKLKQLGLEREAKLIVYVDNINTASLSPTRKKQIYSKVNDLVQNIEQRKQIKEEINDELNLLHELGYYFQPERVTLK
jgi:hypothetical protein